MKTFKEGGHRLFERDPETARIVSEMLDVGNISGEQVVGGNHGIALAEQSVAEV